MISPLLTTDDAVRCRTTARRWDVGCRYGEAHYGASIRDFLAPSDILVLRAAVSKWNSANLYGKFDALWFFLMTDGSECPVMCSDYRDLFFFFCNSMFEPGWLPDLTAFGNSGEC